VDATFGEKLGALRAYTFDHLDVGLQAVGHKGSYSREVARSTKRSRCRHTWAERICYALP
jgi:hypothetical protein